MVTCLTESDYWRIRNFLREVFLLNDRLEHSWHVARLDHWRYHHIRTCQVCAPFEQVTAAWESPDGQIAAVVHPIGGGEIRLHVHPRFRTPELEDEIFAYAEEQYAERPANGNHFMVVPVFADDVLRRQVLTRRGFIKYPGGGCHWWRDLDAPLPEAPVPDGYTIRSMGPLAEHPTRSWASSARVPRRRTGRELRRVRLVPEHPIRPALSPRPGHRRGRGQRGDCRLLHDLLRRCHPQRRDRDGGDCGRTLAPRLGQGRHARGDAAARADGLHRVFSTATEEPAGALYRSMHQAMKVTDTWIKEWAGGRGQGAGGRGQGSGGRGQGSDGTRFLS